MVLVQVLGLLLAMGLVYYLEGGRPSYLDGFFGFCLAAGAAHAGERGVRR